MKQRIQTEIKEGLKNIFCEKQLTELRLFSLEKGRLRGTLLLSTIAWNEILVGGEGGQSLLPWLNWKNKRKCL